MIGRVVSTKMEKTATVLVEGKKKHPLYKKSFVRTKKYLAHDPIGVKDGDIVSMEKSRPFSKRKHWLITKVYGSDYVSLQQAELKEEAEEAIAEVLPEKEEVELSAESDQMVGKNEQKEDKKEKKIKKGAVKE